MLRHFTLLALSPLVWFAPEMTLAQRDFSNVEIIAHHVAGSLGERRFPVHVHSGEWTPSAVHLPCATCRAQSNHATAILPRRACTD